MTVSHLTLVALLFFTAIIWFESVAGQELETVDGVEGCKVNCLSDDRLVGPTRRVAREHPYKIASFPPAYDKFCELGCQLFFAERPTNLTCVRSCDYQYRIQVTPGYSDIAQQANQECRDGCEVAISLCQSGYFCAGGVMTECPAGRYRDPLFDLRVDSLESVHTCVDCPFGRYREASKGKNADECTKCPKGKYANTTGNTSPDDCLRCPAGKWAEEEGMRLCKCITADSCDLEIDIETLPVRNYYLDGVDYQRENIPFDGRH